MAPRLSSRITLPVSSTSTMFNYDMQVIAPCLLTKMYKHKYHWQKWSPAQEYVNRPIPADAQSSHLLNYQCRTEKLYAQHASNSGNFLYTGRRRLI
jgi:hypothetical protein